MRLYEIILLVSATTSAIYCHDVEENALNQDKKGSSETYSYVEVYDKSPKGGYGYKLEVKGSDNNKYQTANVHVENNYPKKLAVAETQNSLSKVAPLKSQYAVQNQYEDYSIPQSSYQYPTNAVKNEKEQQSFDNSEYAYEEPQVYPHSTSGKVAQNSIPNALKQESTNDYVNEASFQPSQQTKFQPETYNPNLYSTINEPVKDSGKVYDSVSNFAPEYYYPITKDNSYYKSALPESLPYGKDTGSDLQSSQNIPAESSYNTLGSPSVSSKQIKSTGSSIPFSNSLPYQYSHLSQSPPQQEFQPLSQPATKALSQTEISRLIKYWPKSEFSFASQNLQPALSNQNNHYQLSQTVPKTLSLSEYNQLVKPLPKTEYGFAPQTLSNSQFALHNQKAQNDYSVTASKTLSQSEYNQLLKSLSKNKYNFAPQTLSGVQTLTNQKGQAELLQAATKPLPQSEYSQLVSVPKTEYTYAPQNVPNREAELNLLQSWYNKPDSSSLYQVASKQPDYQINGPQDIQPIYQVPTKQLSQGGGNNLVKSLPQYEYPLYAQSSSKPQSNSDLNNLQQLLSNSESQSLLQYFPKQFSQELNYYDAQKTGGNQEILPFYYGQESPTKTNGRVTYTPVNYLYYIPDDSRYSNFKTDVSLPVTANSKQGHNLQNKYGYASGFQHGYNIPATYGQTNQYIYLPGNTYGSDLNNLYSYGNLQQSLTKADLKAGGTK